MIIQSCISNAINLKLINVILYSEKFKTHKYRFSTGIPNRETYDSDCLFACDKGDAGVLKNNVEDWPTNITVFIIRLNTSSIYVLLHKLQRILQSRPTFLLKFNSSIQ